MQTLRRTTTRLAVAAAVVSGLGAVVLGTQSLPAAGAEPAYGAPGPVKKLTHGYSLNWAGYARTSSPGTYVEAKATWAVPAVTCGFKERSYSSVWAGIDGDGSNSVEQTGTDSDCSRGRPVYYAWYEMYPNPSVLINHPVSPGDVLTAEVTTAGAGSFTLNLQDTTRSWTARELFSGISAQLASAEVIVEAPSSRSGVLPLADFGTVDISNATVNNGPVGSATGTLDKLIMVTNSLVTKAAPSDLSTGGDAFSVTWSHS